MRSRSRSPPGSARRPSGRPAPAAASAASRSLAGALGVLVGEAAGRQPGGRQRRAGADGVDEDALARVRVREQARERQHGGLRHAVVGHAGRRALARGRGHVDDARLVGGAQVRQRRAGAAHVGQDVELERSHPGGVVDLPPVGDVRAAPTLLTSTSSPPKRSLAAADGVLAARSGGRGRRATPSASGAPSCSSSRGDGGGAVGVAADDGNARAGAASACAVASPMPDVPPVTRQPRPSSPSSTAAILAARRPATRLLQCEAMLELLLVRHGETALNPERRWQGQHDAPLSPAGRAEAQALAERDRRRRSPARSTPRISRARARRLRRSPGVTGLEPTLDARWREVDVGEWLGLTPEEVEARHPEGYARWLAGGTGWEQGETYPEMADARPGGRARRRRARTRAATRPIVCVTHGGVIRAHRDARPRHAARGAPPARHRPARARSRRSTRARRSGGCARTTTPATCRAPSAPTPRRRAGRWAASRPREHRSGSCSAARPRSAAAPGCAR